MQLPKLKSPIHTMTIPSSGQKVKYTAFLVRDEKILAQAIQQGTQEAITDTLKEIIKNCTFDKVDVNKLSSFDIEYIFLQLRAKSKGAVVELQYTCKNDVNGKDCGMINNFSIDIEKVQVDMSKSNKKIMLTDSVGIIMKYPTLENVIEIQMALVNKDANKIYQNMGNFVECVFEGEKVTDTFTNEEFSEWMDTLDTKQFAKIEEFFQTLPTVQAKTHVKCKKCSHEEDIVLEGLSHFLA